MVSKPYRFRLSNYLFRLNYLNNDFVIGVLCYPDAGGITKHANHKSLHSFVLNRTDGFV